MSESLQFGRSIDKGSENIPDTFCEPCYEIKQEFKPVAGYCIDCGDNLCEECFKNHLGPKPLRNHKLVDKTAQSQTQPKPPIRSLKQMKHAQCMGQPFSHSAHHTPSCVVKYAIP